MSSPISGIDIAHKNFRKKLSKYWFSILGQRVITGVVWSIASAIVGRGAGLLASIPMAHILGKEGFGKYGIILSTVMMFSTFVGAGLELTTAKYIAQYKQSDPDRTGRILMLGNIFSLFSGLVGFLLLLFIAPWLASRTLSAPDLGSFISLSSVGVLITMLNRVQNGTLIGFEAFRSVTYRNAVAGIGRFFIMVISTWLWGLKGAVLGIVFSESFLWLINHFAIKKEYRKHNITTKMANCLSEISILWSFSIPSFFSGVIIVLVDWVCNAILVRNPGGFLEMGLYSVSLQWRLFVVFIPRAAGIAILPILSHLFGDSEKKKFNILVQSNFVFAVIITGFGASILSLLSSPILSFYGKGFAGGQAVFTIMCFSAVFFALYELMNRALASQGKMWISFFFALVFALVKISVTGRLVGLGMGAQGLAIATISSFIIVNLFQVLYLKRNLC